MANMARVKSKWRTSWWTKGMAVRDFLVFFNHVDMPLKFRWPMTNCMVGLAISNVPGGAVEWFGHAHFRHPLIIKFFTGPDIYTEFHEFSFMLRPPKRHAKWHKE